MKTVSLLALVLVSLVACKPAPPTAAQPAPAVPGTKAAAAPGDNRPDRPPGGANRADSAQRAKDRLAQMKTDLSLTNDQAQKIGAIMEQRMASMQALRSDQALSREQRQAKLAESRQAIDAQIEAILTPEQKPKWEELRKKREAEMAQRRSNREQGGGAPPPQR